MKSFVHALALVLVSASLLGCSGDDDGSAAPVDAGTDAAIADSGAPDPDSGASDGGMPIDAPADAGFGCGRGAATIGPEGGTLEHCGARVVVPPGVLAEPLELAIEEVGSPGDIFHPYAINGPVLRVTPDDEPLPGLVELHLPHDGTIERQEAARWLEGEGWFVFEICDVTETTVSQSVALLGTFAAVGDPTDYPEGPDGLGVGQVDFDIAGTTDSMSLEPDGYAIYQDGDDGRMITLLYRRFTADVLEQFELRFFVATDGAVEPVLASHYSGATGEIWAADVFAHPGAVTIALTETGAMLRGTAEGFLYRGDVSRPFSATFEGTPVLFRYPPERVCGFPEG